jgi:hypothetical protein
MAYAKKKTEVEIPQAQVRLAAAEALKSRSLTRVRLGIRVRFTTDVLMNQFSQKALTEMLHKQVTGGALPREHKDLESSCDAAVYRNTKNEVVLPCRILKAAIVEGCIGTAGAVTKAEMKRNFRVLGWTSPIALNGELIEDIRLTRNDNGSPDIRGRCRVPAGSTCDFVFEFANTLHPDKIISATAAAGQCIGVCDWRPDRGGEYGTFEIEIVEDEKQWPKIIARCQYPEMAAEVPDYLKRAVAAVPTEKLPDPVRKGLAVAKNGAAQRSVHD